MKLYKCPICGNIVELLEGDINRVTCCGVAMEEIKPNTVDAAHEKHVPFCEIEDDTVKVSIGEVIHPMTEEHLITWIMAEYSDSVVKHVLKPGEDPVVYFDYEKGMKVYAYCNLHGLWMKEL